MTALAGTEERLVAVEALDLLAHWWSRPDLPELQRWQESEEREVDLRLRFSSAVEPSARFGAPRSFADSLRLLEEHERLFVGPGTPPCPPYESQWLDGDDWPARRRERRPGTIDLRLLYRRLGLELQPVGVPPDHLAVELEALAYALSLGLHDGIAEQLLERHVSRWLGRFCRAVAAETRHPFYSGLAELTMDWLEQVRALAFSRGLPRDQPA